MRGSQYLLFLALVALVTCSNVMNLTDKNFNQTIQNNKYVMVKFYAPWCGHCKTMAPEYQKLAELVKDNDVVIGELDATQQKETAQNCKVQGYPTVKFYIDGVGIDYRGERTADQMYGWIMKISQTSLQEISRQKIDQLKAKQSLVVYFGKDQAKKKIFQLLNIVDTTVSYFVSPSSQADQVVLYRVGKEAIQLPSSLQISVQQIKGWVLLNNLPTVVPLSSKQYLDWVFYDEVTMKDVIMLLKEADLTQQGYKNFEQLCEQNRQFLKCCLIDSSMEVYGGVKNYLRSQGNSVLALTKNALKQAYAYMDSVNELTQQAWTQFAQEVSSQKHKNLAAAEADKIKYEHVKVLTDENYTSFIKEHEVVFVEYYSPGCAHCVQFAGQYEKIAKKVYGDENLAYEITAIDLKGNKQVAADLKIMSFPSFKVYLSGEHVTYEGPRTQQSIFNFIQSVKNSKPILAGSIAQIPSPSVIIYDSAEVSSLKLLPALFTRYPIYHIREGDKLKVVLRGEEQKTYSGQNTLGAISKWLFQQTDPILVNLLNSSLDNKLMDALQNKVHLLGLIDTDSELSAALQKTLGQYCEDSTLVCGYAKGGEPNFNEFSAWIGISGDAGSALIYINTQTFDKYLFNKKFDQLSVESIEQFITGVKQGKIQKISQAKKQQVQAPQQQQEAKQPKTDDESKESTQSQQSDKSQQQADAGEL